MLWIVLILLFVVIVGNWIHSQAEKARNQK